MLTTGIFTWYPVLQVQTKIFISIRQKTRVVENVNTLNTRVYNQKIMYYVQIPGIKENIFLSGSPECFKYSKY